MSRASEHRPTVAIIDLDAITHNVKEMRRYLAENQQLYAVVKADAYGHGAVPVAQAAYAAGADGFAVATVDEGIELRRAGLLAVPILVMGLSDPRGIAEILHYQLTPVVGDASWFAQAYQQLEENRQLHLLKGRPLKFHLALDTGMGRIGLRTVQEVELFAQTVALLDWVEWEGVTTHFSTAGGGPVTYVEYQWQQWQQLLTAVPEMVKVRHYANSAMGVWFKHQPASSIERFGIAMYGMHPKDEAGSLPIDVRPAFTLLSEIVYVKELPAGQRVSYGATYETQGDEWIATVPIGYADGWFRHYQSVDLLVDGQACPVVGTINMDQLMIRLPKYYPVGTTVTLIGRDHSLDNHASDIARKVGTISYEIFCGIGERVPRVYIQE